MGRSRSISALAAALLMAGTAFAAGGGEDLEPSGIDRGNVNSLQRGARNFMNYCSGCHSAQYVRYNTIGEDLELSDEQLIGNLMFNAEKTFETINVSMRPADAERWFGNLPPDMSLIARARGADYIYNFLRGFYVSEASPTGVDNIHQPHTSMPHVLAELQGLQTAVFESHDNDDGDVVTEFSHFEPMTLGQLDPKEYDEFVRDTTNFLAYIGEPIRNERRRLGVWVLMFLGFFLIISRMLKKQIWKDVN